MIKNHHEIPFLPASWWVDFFRGFWQNCPLFQCEMLDFFVLKGNHSFFFDSFFHLQLRPEICRFSFHLCRGKQQGKKASQLFYDTTKNIGIV